MVIVCKHLVHTIFSYGPFPPLCTGVSGASYARAHWWKWPMTENCMDEAVVSLKRMRERAPVVSVLFERVCQHCQLIIMLVCQTDQV